MGDSLNYESSSSSDDDDDLSELNFQSVPPLSPPTPTSMDIDPMKLISPMPPSPEPQLFEPVSPTMPVASPPANILKPIPRSIVQVPPSRVHPAKIPLVSASDYRSREKRISTSPPRLSNPPKRLKSSINPPKRLKSSINPPKRLKSSTSRSRPPQNSSHHSSQTPVDSNASSQTPVDSEASTTVKTSAPLAKPSTSSQTPVDSKASTTVKMSAPPAKPSTSSQTPGDSKASTTVKTSAPPAKPSTFNDERSHSPTPAFEETSRCYRQDGYERRRKTHYTGRHSQTFAVLCIRKDGHTLTNGYVYHVMDGPMCPQILLEKLYDMRVRFLIHTDAITKSKWGEVLARLPPFHPAHEIKTVVLKPDAIIASSRCLYCSRAECHRWIAVTKGISKFLHLGMEPIPHRM